MTNQFEAAFKFRSPNVYQNWLDAGIALKRVHGDSKEAYEAWLNWSRQSSKFVEDECLKKWNSFPTKFVPPTTPSQVPTFESIQNWFELAVPEPTDANRSVQLGCHFEEVVEMFSAMGADADHEIIRKIKALSDELKSAPTAADPEKFAADFNDLIASFDFNELLDSLCDQIVTSIGVAHMFGLNIDGALREVDRSNWSKFKDGKPIFDANGKIAKNPETFFKPDLSKFI